mgnify:CR=1 FL=1
MLVGQQIVTHSHVVAPMAQMKHPGDELLVRSYFDGSEEPVFDRAELANKIDLHATRRWHLDWSEEIFLYPSYADE